MVCLSVATEVWTASALGRLFERFGCPVVERTRDHLYVGFPEAASEADAFAEARLYLSMRPGLRAASRLTAVTE